MLAPLFFCWNLTLLSILPWDQSFLQILDYCHIFMHKSPSRYVLALKVCVIFEGGCHWRTVFSWERRTLKRRKSMIWRLDNEGKEPKGRNVRFCKIKWKPLPPNWRIHSLHHQRFHITTTTKKKSFIKEIILLYKIRGGSWNRILMNQSHNKLKPPKFKESYHRKKI